MRARLADVAAQAGVSEATVSRVLNDRPGVTNDKRQAVLTALDLLGYERPPQLRRRTGRPVGIISAGLSDPMHGAITQTLGANFARRGFTPMLGSQSSGGVHEDEYIDTFMEAGAAGILFFSGHHADASEATGRYERLLGLGLPVGFVNGYREGLDAPFFSLDERAGMADAIRHLLSLGHRRIGFANGPAQLVSSQRKLQGFLDAVEEHAASELETWVEWSSLTDDGGVSAARALLAHGCTAIVAASDMMAAGVLAEARTQGLSVPEGLSVVGFDDAPFARHTWPPLTTIRQPATAMSIAIADAFVGEINGVPASRTEYLFRPDLVVRQSSGAVPSHQ